ncbi:uncharacterized protein METZ01_LOCUS204853, partial [marine metagenome]
VVLSEFVNGDIILILFMDGFLTKSF